MRFSGILIAAVAFTVPGAAYAQQDAPLCSDRPGLATPSCVVAPGTLQIETSAIDWTRDEAGGSRNNTILFGDTLLEYGGTLE